MNSQVKPEDYGLRGKILWTCSFYQSYRSRIKCNPFDQKPHTSGKKPNAKLHCMASKTVP
ncbi:hypothetical protein STEG23_000930, partial [Scotinomys teguina]